LRDGLADTLEAPMTSCPARFERELKSLSQVRVGAGQPILAGRTEYIHIERVLECDGPVRHVGGDHEHLSGTRRELALILSPNQKLQRPRENIGQLLVLMVVARTSSPFFRYTADHHALAVISVGYRALRIPPDAPNNDGSRC